MVIEASQSVRLDLLALIGEADVRGRECSDKQALLDEVDLFRELAQDLGCLCQPMIFPSDHSRFIYFAGKDRLPRDAYDDCRGKIILMSGLPGSGKDTWVDKYLDNIPQISLDDIREELAIAATKPQGAVVQRAKERAKEYLRSGETFCWNATNTTKQMRQSMISLFSDYKMRVKIVYVETSWNEMLLRNTTRKEPVPQRVIEKLIRKLDVPTKTEAHDIEYVRG